MQRRTFLTSSAALALSTGLPAFAASAADPALEAFLKKSSFDLRAFTAEVAELVSIDSKTGHEEGNTRIAEIFAERFRSIGWSVETPYCEGRGKALLATNRPDAKRFDIVLCAHTDTVQPVGNAAKYPFRLVDGIAYGAGVADDKSSLNAVWWIAKDLPASVTDRLAVAVVLNPGEESGSKATSAFLRGVAKKSDTVMVFEPGRGEVPGGGFVKVRKGAIFLKVRFHGKAAHAGNNPQDGRNAITAMALAIPKIQDVAKKYPGVTINGDLVSGGTAVNTIAAEAEVTFASPTTLRATRCLPTSKRFAAEASSEACAPKWSRPALRAPWPKPTPRAPSWPWSTGRPQTWGNPLRNGSRWAARRTAISLPSTARASSAPWASWGANCTIRKRNGPTCVRPATASALRKRRSCGWRRNAATDA